MGFALAEAFVDIGANTGGFSKALGSVQQAISGLVNNRSLRAFALGIGAALGAAFAGVVASAAKAEEATEDLRAALQSQMELADANAKAMGNVGKTAKQIGQDANAATTDLSAFAASLSLITSNSKESIEAGMALAANLGVNADQMKTVTEVGIGLAQKYFGGDLKAGMEAASKAVQGNFRELDRIVPGLKATTDASQKLAIVQQYGISGFEQAEARANTFSGQLKVFWNQLNLVAESFGEKLLPYLKKAADWLQGLAIRLQQLTPAQTQMILKWAGIAAAIAAVIALAPAIAAFGGMVVSILGAVGSAILTLGGLIVGLVSSPFALVIAGVAAIVTAFAYFIGAGDTAVSRTIDGFMKIVEFLDHMLGSWQGFTEGVVTIWHQLSYYWEVVWNNIKSVASTVWEYLKSEFPSVVYEWGGALAQFGVKAFSIMRTIAEGIRHIWEETVNYVANLMAEHMVKSQATKDIRSQYEDKKLTKGDADRLALSEIQPRQNAAVKQANDEADEKGMAQGVARNDFISKRMNELLPPAEIAAINKRYEDQFAGRKLNDNELQGMIDKETQYRLDGLSKQRSDAQKAAEDEHNARIKAIGDSTKAQVDAVKQWSKEGMAKTPLDHAREAEAAQKKLADERAQIEANHNKQLADDLAKLYNAPKLSDKVKGAADALKHGLGIDSLSDIIKKLSGTGDDLKKKADDAKDKAKAGAADPKKLKLQGGLQGPEQVKRQDISETFKQLSAMRLLGGQAKKVDPKVALAKAHLDAQKKANELAQKVLDQATAMAKALANAAFPGVFN